MTKFIKSSKSGMHHHGNFVLLGCLEDKSLINCHVFLGFDLLDSRFSVKYFRLAFLILLFVWLRPHL